MDQHEWRLGDHSRPLLGLGVPGGTTSGSLWTRVSGGKREQTSNLLPTPLRRGVYFHRRTGVKERRRGGPDVRGGSGGLGLPETPAPFERRVSVWEPRDYPQVPRERRTPRDPVRHGPPRLRIPPEGGAGEGLSYPENKENPPLSTGVHLGPSTPYHRPQPGTPGAPRTTGHDTLESPSAPGRDLSVSPGVR